MNRLVKNALLGIGFVLAVFLILNICLAIATLHGSTKTVPDFVGKPLGEACAMATKSKMKAVVVDSVFVSKVARGAVYHQNPSAGSKVKKGRTVYLTVNSIGEKMVQMPDLVGLSLRQAKTEITTRGFRLGRLIYVPDIATNNVLEQPIEKGCSIPTGSVIDLVLGRNDIDGMAMVPHLVGKRQTDAVDAAKEGSFNIARISFDGTVKTPSDSLSAFVYRQWPKEGSQALMGSGMVLYLTMDVSKITTEE